MAFTSQFAPLRNLHDVEALERQPLESRLLSQDANVWLRRGLDLAPHKIAIRYINDGDPESTPVEVSYAQLKRDSIRNANLFHAQGVGSGDAVLYLLPTIPQFYPVTIGAMAAGIACSVNWMLEPAHWIELIKGSRAKVVVALGPTPAFNIWERLDSVRAEIPASVRVLSVQGPCWRGASRTTSSPSIASALPTRWQLTSTPAAPPARPSWCGSRIAASPIRSGPIHW